MKQSYATVAPVNWSKGTGREWAIIERIMITSQDFFAIPKTIHYRDKNLLRMAKGRPCLFRIPGVCCGDPETTVAAHGNGHIFGKAKGLKAQDKYTAWACVSCHSWYDQSSASREEKQAAFETAHRRQVIAWDAISESDAESTKDRHSATQALIALDRDAAFVG